MSKSKMSSLLNYKMRVTLLECEMLFLGRDCAMEPCFCVVLLFFPFFSFFFFSFPFLCGAVGVVFTDFLAHAWFSRSGSCAGGNDDGV